MRDQNLSSSAPTADARRIHLLANPRAGRGRGRAVAQAVAQALRAADFEVTTTYEYPAGVGFENRPDAVVIVGGDGTLRLGVERLVEIFPENPPPILPVPMGTANLMGQYLGLPRSLADIGLEGVKGLAQGIWEEAKHRQLPRHLPSVRLGPLKLSPRRIVRRLLPPSSHLARETAQRVVAALVRGEVRCLDVGVANDRLFLLMAGVGFDAHVVHVLDERRRGPIGLLSYALPAASAVARYGFPPIRVDVEGQRLFGPRPAVVMIANVPQYGMGFPIIPGAVGDDGRLDVLCMPCASRAELGKLIALAADGRHLSMTGVARAQGRRVRVTSPAPVPVQIDGDPGGHLPLEARLLDRQVPIIVPMF